MTVNYGVRWDADPNTTSAPNIKTNSILIDQRLTTPYFAYGTGVNDYGYKTGIKDWKNVAPRVGFTYNVGGNNDFVIRGGTGLYYASPVSNVTFSPSVYSNLITATFPNDGRAELHHQPDQRRAGRGVPERDGAAAGAVAARHRRHLQESRTRGRAASASRSS